MQESFRSNSSKGLEKAERVDVKQEMHAPFSIVTSEKFAEWSSGGENLLHPEQTAMMDRTLETIETQAIENFSIYESKDYPGVAFSRTTLSITPQTIRHILGSKIPEVSTENDRAVEQLDNVDEEPRQVTYVLFTAFGLPPDGHAFTVQDVAIDRFVRLLPQVANAIKEGRQPPEVTIHMLGAPTGFGGSVTSDWIETIQTEGINAHGKLYAEFLNQSLPTADNNSRTVLQGVSKGAVVAHATSQHLTEDIRNDAATGQQKVQLLLDNPSGDHATGRGKDSRRIITGWFKEVGSTIVDSNSSLRRVMKHQGAFLKELEVQTGVSKDSLPETLRKLQATWAELQALLDGAPVDEKTRAFIRRAAHDPLSVSPEKFEEIVQKVEAEGLGSWARMGAEHSRVSETPVVDPQRTHFFFYDNFRRWAEMFSWLQHNIPTEK